MLASLVTLAIANTFPIVTLTLQGATVNATLPDALLTTWQQGHRLVATMCALFGLLFPLGQLCFQLWALGCIKKGSLPADFRYGMRVLYAITSWSMVPVLVLGILVALVKLSGMATAHVGPSLFAFGALIVLMTISGRLSAHQLWRYAEDAGLVKVSGAACQPGDSCAACESCGHVQPSQTDEWPCSRCGARVSWRKPGGSMRVLALVIAASILYLPANLLPVMQIRLPTGTSAHTILGGVLELWQMGSLDLALVVFTASVLVPITKLLALLFLLSARQWRGERVQRQRTRLYQMVEFVGHWSMLDVFVVLLLTAMADFPGLSQVMADNGAPAFGAVVILTMFAAMAYDPRKGWDHARLPADSSSPDTLHPINFANIKTEV